MNKYIKCVVCWGMVSMALLSSCNDEWDSHYESDGGVPGVSLMDLLRRDSRLEKFCQIIEKTHGDTLLSSTQTYTVWAPRNEALADVDMDDMDALRRLVKNHIARYTNPSSTSPEKKIYMLNNKIMSFKDSNRFMDASIEEKDMLAQNGVLHVLREQIPYQFNILERMATDANYSKVYDFITRWNQKNYDPGLSTAYDSVFVDYNPMLESLGYGIGLLDNEDSLYTMIIPDNAAWDEAMARLQPYFKPGSKLTGDALIAYQDSASESRAGQAILAGLTFPGVKFQNAQGEFVDPVTWDSLYTVDRHLLYKKDLQAYFNGYDLEKASNGYMYLAHGHLNMADTCTWNLPVKVEGENSYYTIKDLALSSAIRTTTDYSAVQGVSGNAYLEMSASNNNTGVTFKLPQVLAGKYEIWVDYVPPIIDGVAKKTRMQYQLKYTLENGSLPLRPNVTFKEDNFIVVNAMVYEGGADASNMDMGVNEGVESERPMVKEHVIAQKVGEVEFPVADYYDGMWHYDEQNANITTTINTTLKVLFNVSSAELKDKEWERTVRIDRVRLVPVLE